MAPEPSAAARRATRSADTAYARARAGGLVAGTPEARYAAAAALGAPVARECILVVCSAASRMSLARAVPKWAGHANQIKSNVYARRYIARVAGCGDDGVVRSRAAPGDAGGAGGALWPCTDNARAPPPACGGCGSPRLFELEVRRAGLVAPMARALKRARVRAQVCCHALGSWWDGAAAGGWSGRVGAVAVYTCAASCGGAGWAREHAVVAGVEDRLSPPAAAWWAAAASDTAALE